ncbi:ADP-ribose diphosphatase [Paraglaciecola chathamensis]|uniref:ADP-ribose diphosphatase n=1 Tax=Paraglaciecola chathamensis TaxID=368405 RepID=UPI0026F6D403|nr:ADP-ribose diphosphatase [Paraglaciecola chathamensis]MDO6559048.1 ADP-ribose diphosphatase [Paraglaciecola chathamensis]
MSKIQQFSSKDVEITRKESLYSGFFKMVKYHFKHKLYKGGWSETVEREIFERGHAVAVLPYDPHLKEFVMVEQIRIGALATSDSPWLLEIVAGIIDPGETPEAVCYREAQEEAGVTITHLKKAISYLASPGGTTERLHIYVAQVDASQAKGVHGLDYESEDILVHRVPEDQALEWINQGKIDNAATLIALQWFAMNKQRVLDDWKD